MATTPDAIQGTIDGSLEEAGMAIRRAAASNGYALDEGRTTSDELVFKKGFTLVSWGSMLTVHLEAASDTETRFSVSTKETFAITDWGRGRRAATKVLTDAGARVS